MSPYGHVMKRGKQEHMTTEKMDAKLKKNRHKYSRNKNWLFKTFLTMPLFENPNQLWCSVPPPHPPPQKKKKKKIIIKKQAIISR